MQKFKLLSFGPKNLGPYSGLTHHRHYGKSRYINDDENWVKTRNRLDPRSYKP